MSKITPQAADIFTPQEGDTCDVKTPAGTPPDPNQPGILCYCNGNVTRDPSGYLYGVAVRCKQGTLTDAQFPNSEVTQGSPNTVYFTVGQFIGTYTWESEVVPAFGNTTEVANSIKAVARFFPTGSGSPEDSRLTHFKGIWTDTCPTRSLATASKRKSTIVVEMERHPTQRDGDWLLYEGLPVSAIGAGNLLSLHGAPLRAKVLAVSVARVHWWSTLSGGIVVRRPVGDISPTGLTSACPFPGLPRNAMIVNQSQHRHVLMSQCRDRPDLIDLNRNENVRVQVNFESPVLPTAQLLAGSYDLWVKIID